MEQTLKQRVDAILWLAFQQGHLTDDELGYLIPAESSSDFLERVIALLFEQGTPLLDEQEDVSVSPALPLLYSLQQEQKAGWKNHPARVLGPRQSKCCLQPTVLVHSMKRGFVGANCTACGTRETLTEIEFKNLPLWVSCPVCKVRMWPELLQEVKGDRRLAGNYGYGCSDCRIFLLLADLLPSWLDLVYPGRTGMT